MDIIKRLKYPKLILLAITFVLAYVLFTEESFAGIREVILSSGYVGVFIAGLFFSYGFTAGPATATLLLLAKEQNILLAGLIGGFGALIADMIIFKFVRHSLADEIEELRHEKIVKGVSAEIYAMTPNAFKKYLIPVVAGFIIASPLPDEVGITLFAASEDISAKVFSIISYSLNTVGIIVILLIGKAI